MTLKNFVATSKKVFKEESKASKLQAAIIAECQVISFTKKSTI